jgi:hypothetical protein
VANTVVQEALTVLKAKSVSTKGVDIDALYIDWLVLKCVA